MSYDERKPALHVDGSRIFQTREDIEAQKQIAAELAELWKIELHQFAALFPIDWYSVADARVTGLLELKKRDHASTTHSTVFLSFRKWHHLEAGGWAFNVPGVFVVRFSDVMKWIVTSRVDPRQHRIAGTQRRGKDETEPLIDVPVADMLEVRAR